MFFYSSNSTENLNGNGQLIRDIGLSNSNYWRWTDTSPMKINVKNGHSRAVWAFPAYLTSNDPKFKYYIAGDWRTLEGVNYIGEVTINGNSNNTKYSTAYKVYTYTPVSGNFVADTELRLEW